MLIVEICLFFVIFQESRDAQRQIVDLERELGQQSVQLEALTEEKVRLLREIAQLRANTRSGPNEDQALNPAAASSGGYYFTSTAVNSQTTPGQQSGLPINSNIVPKVSANNTISSVGALRLYEFLLGLFFIAAMMNWIIV